MSSTLVLFIGLINDCLYLNLSISSFDLVVVPLSELTSANYTLLAKLSISQFALAVLFLSDPFQLSIFQPALLILLSIFVFMRILLLLFNEQIFYTFSNILKYICDYPEVEKYVCL